MRQPTRRLATVQRAKPPLSLIDEDTQLTTFHYLNAYSFKFVLFKYLILTRNKHV